MLARPSPIGSHVPAAGLQVLVGERVAPPRRVLVADDDDETRSLLASQLRLDGYDVIEAVGGAEVSALLAELRSRPDEAPELIVTDICMPSQTGLELLAELRKAELRVPVILMTGFGGREIHERARELGAIAVFEKPFDVDDLRTAILNFLPALPPPH